MVNDLIYTSASVRDHVEKHIPETQLGTASALGYPSCVP